MKAVGDIGLLKIDFLGLQNLDIIATCVRLIKERRGIDIDLEHLEFDDAKTYELISIGDTHGVFQLEGAGMRRMLMDMRPQSFEDVSAAIALFRPGPMVNIPAFIARKQSREPIEYMHERLEPILRETYGVMIYQEQVMMAARELAGFTMSEADILRAAMGKKDKVKMAKLRTKFVDGTGERGIPKATGEALLESIVAMRDADGAFKSLEDLCERTSAIQDVNRRVLEALVQSGACDSLGERARLIAALDHAVSRAERARRDRESGQTSLLEMVGSEEVTADDYGLTIDVAPMAGEEKLRLEKELLGLYLSDHPLRRISAELAKLSDTQAVEVTSALQDTEVRVAGLVREVRRVVTRKGQIMAYATLEDLTGSVDVVVFPRQFEQYRLLFEPDKVVVVQGKVDARAGSTRASGAAASPVEPEIEAEVETASVVADMAWLWDDPDCVPVSRRQLVHVRIPNGEAGLAEQLTALTAAIKIRGKAEVMTDVGKVESGG